MWCSGLRMAQAKTVAQVQSLAQELPHAAGAAERKKGTKKETKERKETKKEEKKKKARPEKNQNKSFPPDTTVPQNKVSNIHRDSVLSRSQQGPFTMSVIQSESSGVKRIKKTQPMRRTKPNPSKPAQTDAEVRTSGQQHPNLFRQRIPCVQRGG